MASQLDARPDPDQLLEQLRSEEVRAKRGRLRIYFGASAGVGKTYAMLSAAQREREAGREVVIGVIETHGRSDTAELVDGLELLPLKDIARRGRTLKEFDLDAALKRKPRVLLVDELAHSNVEGSRHPKRWQDVQELLEAGIDVWSALNVQHLESLNGTVGAITGIRIHETVPDTVIETADEVILIDVTPDELISRLKAGKVYLPQQAERAAQNFFRKGNLIALREIALRRTAEHVEDDVRNYRVEKSIAPVWNTEGAILVCIGAREGAEQTVRVAARLAGQMNVRWYAAYVETPYLQRLAASERDRILAVIKLAEDLGSSTAVLTGSDAAEALVSHAQTLNCATLVVGRPAPNSWRSWGARSMTRQLAVQAPTLDIVEVGHAESTRRLSSSVQRTQEETSDTSWYKNGSRYAWAIGSVVLITLLATPLLRFFDLANIVMLFLLGTVLVAVKFGRGPAALAAFLNVAAFDYFFVPPRLSFAVSDVQYLLTFVVMLAVGLLTGQLTAGLRFQARISSSRERRAQSLFELTRDLSAALLSTQVIEMGEAAVQRNFEGQALVLVTDANDQLVVPVSIPAGFDASVADWALRNEQAAGLSTTTLSSHPWHYMPLKAPMRVRGILALKPAQPRWLLIPEQLQQLDTLARQIAIALERVHYVEIAQQAVVQMESERLRNTLLAAMSHDIRTPLTALVGQAELLATSLPLTQRQIGLAQSISQEARELGTLVTNILEMARLESGQVDLRKDWQSVEEVIGSAIRSARHALGALRVKTEIPDDLPLVDFDASLMERVLINLLENTAKYGVGDYPADPAIVISASLAAGKLVMTVRDFGPGLPMSVRGNEDKLFAKFTRGHHESATRGVGLGLAICKAIMDAHGGTIKAAQAVGEGAQFTLTLPIHPAPLTP